MPKAVRFNEYGDIDVLQVVEVDRPQPGPGQVLVRVKAAAINPGEAKIRNGSLHDRWPATFPSGQGSDLAGVVDELGAGVDTVAVGDEVVGFTDNRASQAEFVLVEAANLTPKPAEVPWEVAGSMFVAGSTSYATVRAVAAGPGDTVVVSGAAGGVGSLAVQLARKAGATVIALASERNHDWLRSLGAIPVAYGENVAERITTVGKPTAFIDTYGADYVELALKLGIAPDRIDTVVNFAAAQEYGVKVEGSAFAATAAVMAELLELVRTGELQVPIARVYPLDEVQDAYRELEQGHTRGKIVLTP